MNDLEFKSDLLDRIAKIQSINKQYNLLDNSYIAFSGGKDSVVLSHLIDIALPNNKIPRVYSNTGIEFVKMVKFVKELAVNDNRIIILNNTKNIISTLNYYGFPFKSKKHSQFVSIYQNSGMHYGIENYLNTSCPKVLKYQFLEANNLKISSQCCIKFKEEVVSTWAKENNKKINITGLRKEEGGQRSKIDCVLVRNNKLLKFHPLSIIDEIWENEFIKRFNIKLCELYYPPFNFKRTGCKGCPFNINISEELNILYKVLPNEYKQCLHLWKPVYDEYIRIGYRLKKYPHEEGGEK